MGSSNTTYSEDDLPVFTPIPWSLKDIRAAIPDHLFARDTRRSLSYLVRDLAMATAAAALASHIDPFFTRSAARDLFGTAGAEVVRWAAWCVYWYFQALIFSGIWFIGHDCNHGAFSDHPWLNDTLGFIMHSFLLTPYFSWKISHHRHHTHTASVERDELFVPPTRSELGLPKEGDPALDYDEILGDTPIYTLFTLIRQQALAFPAYLLFNVSGQKSYSKWTNHFNPNCVLFTAAQRKAIVLSDIGVGVMFSFLVSFYSRYGAADTFKYYGIPWLGLSHWLVVVTYLHHTDPAIPHYRGKEWTPQRGAAATMDRTILGWQGRFFLHDISRYHVVHHFFPKMPFYHSAEATLHLKALIGEHYHESDVPVFKALWQSYNKCQFIEDEGGVVFYRDRKGRVVRRPSERCSVDTKTQ